MCLSKPPRGCLPQPWMFLRLQPLDIIIGGVGGGCLLVFYSLGENRRKASPRGYTDEARGGVRTFAARDGGGSVFIM